MIILDQVFQAIAPACLIIFVGAIVSFCIVEISIFFYDRKKKKEDESNS